MIIITTAMKHSMRNPMLMLWYLSEGSLCSLDATVSSQSANVICHGFELCPLDGPQIFACVQTHDAGTDRQCRPWLLNWRCACEVFACFPEPSLNSPKRVSCVSSSLFSVVWMHSWAQKHHFPSQPLTVPTFYTATPPTYHHLPRALPLPVVSFYLQIAFIIFRLCIT